MHSSMLPKQKVHQFLVRTFSSPTKCNHCTSLMVGLTRQGVVCELCGFACHTICCQKVPTVCPVPSDQTKRPLGIDPTRGIGTAYEGYVKVPKMGAVKRGWIRQFVVVCDFKLFLYDITADRSALPSVHVSQVLDMRDPEFSVTGVRESDVIHATKKDVPCIFRVCFFFYTFSLLLVTTTYDRLHFASISLQITTSLIDGGQSSHTLMLADTESEKAKWVVALSELHRILKRNNLPNTAIFRVREVLDSTLSVIRGALSSLIIDPDRILLGTEDGLFCLDLDRSGTVFLMKKESLQTILFNFLSFNLQKWHALAKANESFNYGIYLRSKFWLYCVVNSVTFAYCRFVPSKRPMSNGSKWPNRKIA